MNLKVLAATIAGSITIFLLGYLIFGILLVPYMKADEIQYAGLHKMPPDFLLLMLKNIVQAILLVYIFEYLAGIRTFLGGMKVGAIIMFLITLSLNLSLLSIMNLHKGFTVRHTFRLVQTYLLEDARKLQRTIQPPMRCLVESDFTAICLTSCDLHPKPSDINQVHPTACVN